MEDSHAQRFYKTMLISPALEILKYTNLEGGPASTISLSGENPIESKVLAALLGTPFGELFAGSRSPTGIEAGMWLYYSQLERSHAVSQQLLTSEGSFWHGIMHRREPDPSNAAYWFRRVGKHPIYPALAEEAGKILGERWGIGWDPYRFIDFCEEARLQPGSQIEKQAIAIQLAEWQLLMQYCIEPS